MSKDGGMMNVDKTAMLPGWLMGRKVAQMMATKSNSLVVTTNPIKLDYVTGEAIILYGIVATATKRF